MVRMDLYEGTIVVRISQRSPPQSALQWTNHVDYCGREMPYSKSRAVMLPPFGIIQLIQRVPDG